MQTSLDMFTDKSQMFEYFRRPLCFFFIYPDTLTNDRVPRGATNTPKDRSNDTMNIEPPTDDIGNQVDNRFHMEIVAEPTPYFNNSVDEFVEIEIIFADDTNPKRNWSAYNQAQIVEGEVFERLLRDLCDTIPEPERQGAGRPGIPLSDQVFCAVLKSYSMMSSRRAHTKLRGAESNGNLEHAPHFNQVSKTLLKRQVTPILQSLIRESAIPLASIETDFAVDSSGFSTSKFSAYHGIKHNVKKTHDWVKAHICSGVITNIVTDVVVTGGHANDSPHFDSLVSGTAEGFKISEVSADKAYSSRKNHDIPTEYGGEALIPFKKNAIPRAGGSPAWKKAFHYFQLHREDFEARYHKRSNVETTFGAIKAKFGEHLKSKKWLAQGNELLCKILAYNITVLIHEM